MGLFGSVLVASLNILLSVILAVALFAFLAVEAPDFLKTLYGPATAFGNYITNSGWLPTADIVMGFLITKEQLVLLAFVIVIRIVLAFIFGMIGSAFGYR